MDMRFSALLIRSRLKRSRLKGVVKTRHPMDIRSRLKRSCLKGVVKRSGSMDTILVVPRAE
eukprot:12078148-Alexandrium_andersonii.AAC.1